MSRAKRHLVASLAYAGATGVFLVVGAGVAFFYAAALVVIAISSMRFP